MVKGKRRFPLTRAEQVPERAKDASSHGASLIAYTFIQTESGTFDRTQNRKVPVPSVPLIFCKTHTRLPWLPRHRQTLPKSQLKPLRAPLIPRRQLSKYKAVHGSALRRMKLILILL